MRILTVSLVCCILLGGSLAMAQNQNQNPPGVPLNTGKDPITIPSPIARPNPLGTNPITIRNPNESPIATPIGNPLGNPIDTPDVTPGDSGGAKRPPGPTSFRVYVGTYTTSKSKSEGIYQFTLDTTAGTLANPLLVGKLNNPSFLAIHPSRKFLYAVSEVNKFGGKSSGSVSSFAIDPKSGNLTLLNTEPTGGADPCYVAVDATGADALVANYTGGSVRVFPIGGDGKLSPASSTIQHEGSGVNKARQSGPHAHSIDLDPTNRYALVADLGLDRLLVYHFDPKAGTLRPNIPPFASIAPGSGPRHLAFQPDGLHAYLINEMGSTITVLDYEASRGVFSTLQTISTRADANKSDNATAEIVVHPSGRFVYGSNRGDDSLAIYAADRASGKLTLVGFQETGGKTPRNFAIDPTGQFLLAGNQDSNTITLFRVDQKTGQLTPAGDPIPCPAPVCIRFLPL